MWKEAVAVYFRYQYKETHEELSHDSRNQILTTTLRSLEKNSDQPASECAGFHSYRAVPYDSGL
jgi:hypothetical protein